MTAATAAPNNGRPVLTPNPDPTALTYELVERQVSALRELHQQRFDQNEKAVILLQTQIDKIPKAINEEVNHLETVNNVKFSSIQTQFEERDTRTEQSNAATKTAVDAALQAAEKAVGKTETSFTKQFDAIADLIRQMTKAIDDKVEPVKDRLGLIESRQTAIESRREGSGDQTRSYQGLASLAIGLGGVVIAAVVLLSK